MIDEWGGTLTLAEASSRELMRVLKEQDDEFMDNLFNGKCGFTLKCTDGRSVELVPKEDRKTENCSEIPNNCEEQKWTKENCKGCKYNEYPYDSSTCFVRVCINGNKYEPKTEPLNQDLAKNEPTLVKDLVKDEPQTEEWYTWQDEQEYNDRWQTDPQTERSE